MKDDKFKGIFPAVITPYDEGEEVDESRLKDFLDYVIEGGVHGIYLLGTNGEGPLLTFQEKKRVIETALEHVAGRVPVIVGSMCNSTKNTIELSKYAESKGADAVHAIVPYYYPVTKNGLKNHIKELAEEVDIPIFLYSIPQFTGNEIEPHTLGELSELDDLIGLKDSSGDIGFFYQSLNEVQSKRDDFVFFGGNDSLILTYLMMGGDGSVTAVGNAFPGLVADIFEEYMSGNIETAKDKQKKVWKIKDIFSGYPTMSAVKGTLKVLGEDFGGPRRPLQSLNDRELKKLERKLKDINVI
ncbi:MAG: dihydrodipicolinate synthase family protein [Thermoplasmata archaeon]